jgi:tetratricopeptide (TPR) repeat protein
MDTYRYDEAIHYYQKIVSEFDISSYPDHIYNAWKNMGISELKIAENLNGRDRENALLQAEQSFAKCIEIYPDWDSNFGRWAALHALGREKEAQAALDQSIRLAGGARIPFLQDLIGSLKEILTKLTGAHRDVSGN